MNFKRANCKYSFQSISSFKVCNILYYHIVSLDRKNILDIFLKFCKVQNYYIVKEFYNLQFYFFFNDILRFGALFVACYWVIDFETQVTTNCIKVNFETQFVFCDGNLSLLARNIRIVKAASVYSIKGITRRMLNFYSRVIHNRVR